MALCSNVASERDLHVDPAAGTLNVVQYGTKATGSSGDKNQRIPLRFRVGSCPFAFNVTTCEIYR